VAALTPRTLRIGAIALVAVLALAAGVASAGGGNRVRAVNYSFKPGTIVIHKGQTVTWRRVEGHHTVTFKDGSFDKQLNRSYPRVSRTFRKRGTFRYFCSIHRKKGMRGKVVVRY
jgi:plastocyanin